MSAQLDYAVFDRADEVDEFDPAYAYEPADHFEPDEDLESEGPMIAVRSPRARKSGRGRGRVVLAMLGFVALYGALGTKLVMIGMMPKPGAVAFATAQDAVAAARPNIVDRNGEILATDLNTASLYAEPRKIIDLDEAIEGLATVFPDLDNAETRKKLSSKAGFVWLKREISARDRERIHKLGIPGLEFLTENRRFYPGGALAGDIVGTVNIDNQGISGIEKAIDDRGLRVLQQTGLARTGSALEPVRLSIDIRVQHVVRDEVQRVMTKFHAKAGVGIVLAAKTGEVLGMASLPDFDPNDPAQALDPNRMNRATAGVFELGSVMKTFTFAMALDCGCTKLTDGYDTRGGLHIDGFTIHDFHAQNRVLSVPEIFTYSSNIGTAKMALHAGIDREEAFLKKIGMLDRLHSELPEMAAPIRPRRWTNLTGATIAFGHGLSVTPMHAAIAAAALMNGGHLFPPTFFPRTEAEAMAMSKQVVSARTSDDMRALFRLNALKGSGRKAQVPGFQVGGKTGTAEKIENGRYVHNKNLNSFLAAFPMDDPQYIVLVVLDEPKAEDGVGAPVAAYNAAPAVANIISRIGPMLHVVPDFRDTASDPVLASIAD